MALEIITAKSASDHVDSNDIAMFQKATYGSGIVLNTKEQFSSYVQNSNNILIRTGDAIMPDGRYVSSRTYTIVYIESGRIGYRRNDLIGIKYNIDDSGIESCNIEVIKGSTVISSSYPSLPSYDENTFFPLYSVEINGVTLSTPVQMFKILNDASTDNIDNLINSTNSRLDSLIDLKDKKSVKYYTYTPASNMSFELHDASCPIEMFVIGNVCFVFGMLKAKNNITLGSGTVYRMFNLPRKTGRVQYLFTKIFEDYETVYTNKSSYQVVTICNNVSSGLAEGIFLFYNYGKNASGSIVNSIKSGQTICVNSVWDLVPE